MVSKKDRRRSGQVTPNPVVSKKELEKYDLIVEPFWDDWCDYRDGFRDGFSDFKLIKKVYQGGRFSDSEWLKKRIKMNEKQKKLVRRRKKKQAKLNHRLAVSFSAEQSSFQA